MANFRIINPHFIFGGGYYLGNIAIKLPISTKNGNRITPTLI